MEKDNGHNVIKVLLTDDNSLMRDAIRQLLSNYDDIVVVGECSDGEDVCEFLACNQVDVVLMDISMRKMDGIKATKLVNENYPDTKIIAYSSRDKSVYKDAMYAAGASGYLTKGKTPAQEIIQTIRTVYLSRLMKK